MGYADGEVASGIVMVLIAVAWYLLARSCKRGAGASEESIEGLERVCLSLYPEKSELIKKISNEVKNEEVKRALLKELLGEKPRKKGFWGKALEQEEEPFRSHRDDYMHKLSLGHYPSGITFQCRFLPASHLHHHSD